MWRQIVEIIRNRGLKKAAGEQRARVVVVRLDEDRRDALLGTYRETGGDLRANDVRQVDYFIGSKLVRRDNVYFQGRREIDRECWYMGPGAEKQAKAKARKFLE